MGEISNAGSQVGISGLGSKVNTDVTKNLNLTVPNGVPTNPLSKIATENVPTLPSAQSINQPSLGTEKVNASLPAVSTGLKMPGEINGVVKELNEAKTIINEAGAVVKQGEAYTKEIAIIKQEGLGASEKLPELIEQQALKLDQIRELQKSQAAMEKETKQLKELMEQYKNEQQVKKEIEKKATELATDKLQFEKGKVDETMKDLKKYKRKFSEVHDLRNLPRRAPNPLRGLSWRDRVVPGFNMLSISNTKFWIELAPQAYYRINNQWTAGIAAQYRFSLDAGNFGFNDFGDLVGQSVFVQYHAFKGFFLRTEMEHAKWKSMIPIPDFDGRPDIYKTSIGIGKSHQFSKYIKGTVQTLYHHTWQKADPYPLIEIHFGFDFIMSKREVKHWKAKLKELEKKAKGK